MDGFKQILIEARNIIAALKTKEILVLMGGAAFVTGIVILFGHLIATPDYKPLMTGMEASDAQALGARLAAKSVPYQISQDGKTVSVPADKIDSSRLEVASEGMPRSGRLGFEIFDKLNWGQTEFDEKVNYQRALEGELERTIATLRDVESARVHLVMPTDSVFVDREGEAKASVILKLRSGQLSDETHRAIASLVSGAVEKLTPQNVTVIDADTNQPLISHHGNSATDAELETQLSQRLVSTLEPVVGAQRVRASVNVEYDPSTSEENRETYDPKSAVAITMQRTEEQVGSKGAIGGIPGTASNVPAGSAPNDKNATALAKATEESDDDTVSTSKSENGTYAVDKLTRHTLQPAGRIRRVSAALLVDDAIDIQEVNGKSTENRRKRTPEELKQIEALAAAAIGLDKERGDTLAVQNLSFQQLPQDAPPAPTKLEKVRVTLNDWSSSIRYVVIFLLFLLVYLFLIRPIKRQAMEAFRQLPSRSAELLKAETESQQLGGVSSEILSLTDVQRRTLGLQKQLAEKVKNEPAVTGRVLQAWLEEAQ
jgi:flagellar M-ring protein FliF